VAPRAAAVRRTVRATRAHRHVAPRWVVPLHAGVSSYYGPRWGRMHEGIDLNAPYGAKVRAIGAGRVIGAGYLPSESGYGIIVLVRHANGAVSAYAHLSKASVSAGERVQPGDVVGRVGNTGHSFGAHLHFEIRVGGQPVNPLKWLRKRGVRI
jgi:murein DD-endopeptidase MepM/ murein hydrolase activator NlpD